MIVIFVIIVTVHAMLMNWRIFVRSKVIGEEKKRRTKKPDGRKTERFISIVKVGLPHGLYVNVLISFNIVISFMYTCRDRTLTTPILWLCLSNSTSTLQ